MSGRGCGRQSSYRSWHVNKKCVWSLLLQWLVFEKIKCIKRELHITFRSILIYGGMVRYTHRSLMQTDIQEKTIAWCCSDCDRQATNSLKMWFSSPAVSKSWSWMAAKTCLWSFRRTATNGGLVDLGALCSWWEEFVRCRGQFRHKQQRRQEKASKDPPHLSVWSKGVSSRRLHAEFHSIFGRKSVVSHHPAHKTSCVYDDDDRSYTQRYFWLLSRLTALLPHEILNEWL